MGKRKLKFHSPELRQHVIAGKPIYTFERLAEEKEILDRPLWPMDPREREVYDPPYNKRIMADGGWAIIIKSLPHLSEPKLNRSVRVGRVFYIEHDEGVDEFGFAPNGRYKVVAKTRWGTVWLWPYEYAVLEPDKLIALWQAGELIFHPTDMEPGRLNDVLHYIRSRGIGVADAMVMALGSIKGNVGWFEPPRSLAKACEQMSERFNHWKPKRKSKKPMTITITMDKEFLNAQNR